MKELFSLATQDVSVLLVSLPSVCVIQLAQFHCDHKLTLISQPPSLATNQDAADLVDMVDDLLKDLTVTFSSVCKEVFEKRMFTSPHTIAPCAQLNFELSTY